MSNINIDFSKPQIMAIVNATDDSFYAESRTMSVEAVQERVRKVLAEGATIIDVGGYSSRPGAEDVSLEQEWARVDMALSAVRAVDADVLVSIDTFRAEIVRRAVAKYGLVIVNDITAGEGDADMVATVAALDVPYVAMHMRGTPQTMQTLSEYDSNKIADSRITYSPSCSAAHCSKSCCTAGCTIELSCCKFCSLPNTC